MLNQMRYRIQSLGVRGKARKRYHEMSAKIAVNSTFEKLFPLEREAGSDNRRISLAITHYNRPQLIRKALTNVLRDQRIDDIVIYDDCSATENFEEMVAIIGPISPKISIHRGEENIGPYSAKIRAVSKCRNDWAIILDSDNFLSRSYVDKLYEIPQWNSRVLYCPSFAKPDFDFRYLVNTEINLAKAREILLKKEKIKLFRNFLNDGNYFVPVRNYVLCGHALESLNVRAADVIVLNHSWLKMGHGLCVLKGLQYYHCIHSGSYQMSTWRDSRKVVDDILNSIVGLSA